MDIKCNDCGERWYEVFGALNDKKCDSCGSKKLTWILSANYQKRQLGEWKVKNWVELKHIEVWDDKEDPRGSVEFDPKIFCLLSPEDNYRYYWFPYWIKIKGKRRYGQFSPIVPEDEFIQLMTDAIDKNVFSSKVQRKLLKHLLKKS